MRPASDVLSDLGTFEAVDVQLDRQVLTVTLNRPDRLNALNRDVLETIWRISELVEAAPEVRAVVVAGAGEKAFVSGADITEFDDLSGSSGYDFARRGQRIMDRWESLPVPSIALIDGWTLGGGCELALACTLRIASDRSRFGLPEIRLGVMPGYGGTQRLTRIVGRGVAAEMMLTGEPITAQRAYEIGLVNAVSDPQMVSRTAYEMAEKLADRPSTAVRYVLAALDAADPVTQDSLRLEAGMSGLLTSTEDKQEGVAAFRDKRQPQWSERR